MKISTAQLKRIIREELQRVLFETGAEDTGASKGDDSDTHSGKDYEKKEGAPYGGNKGDIPAAARKKKTHSGKPGGASRQDVEQRKGIKGMDK